MKQLLYLLMFLWGAQGLGQSQPAVDFLHARIAIEIDTATTQIHGKVSYTFDVLSTIDSVKIDAVGMTFDQVLIDGRKIRYRYDGKHISLQKRFKEGRTYEVYIQYNVRPKQAVYFVGWDNSLPENNQIWTQGQGTYTSYWVPSFDDMTEKVAFDLSITFDKTYEVAANGKLTKTMLSGDQKTWQFEMQHPMSSYLLAFAIGIYHTNSLRSASGVPIELYYEPRDSLRLEPTYRYSQRIFDFLESTIGVPYPWQNYRQVPVRDFLYAGMENAGCTLFSENYMIDSVAFKDRNYVNINAHELAHQWFGDLVTEKSGKHHWLHEGFATYFAYLTEKDIFGDEYFYWKLYESARALRQLADEGGGEALTNPGAGSLTFYEKGAWALYMLHEAVGDINFKKGIRNYLQQYAYSNATVDDFLGIMERSAGISLKNFREEWLEASEFPYQEAMEKLSSACGSIKQFLALQSEVTATTASNETIIEKYWEDRSPRWKQEVVKAYFHSLSPVFVKKILSGREWMVRQAVAMETVHIPTELKEGYESLLSDPSYVTQEAVLYKLWIYFDNDRVHYLERCRGIMGFSNKNLRMLWLSLALLTPQFDADMQSEYYKELSGYTSPRFDFATRQLAFQYLNEAFAFSDASLKDLIRATVHPAWQFRKYARSLLDQLLQDEGYRKRLEKIAAGLKESELPYINQKLKGE